MLPFFQSESNHLPNMLNEFYKQVFYYGHKLYNTPIINAQDAEKQILLWYNANICSISMLHQKAAQVKCSQNTKDFL